MSKWRSCTIGDLVKEKVIAPPMDGNHGDIHPKGADFTASGIPFVMASDINDSIIDLVGCKFISKDQADSLRKGFALEGDVLLTHKATIGRTVIVPETQFPYLMLTPQVTYYRVLDKEKLDNRFLKYYFDYKPFQETLGLWAGAGSTRAYLGITGQHNLSLRVPDIQRQKSIADVLSAIDAKIELNNRINAELEAMAKTLYDYWFVQFDFPFDFAQGKPAANGKPYKSAGGKMVYNPTLKREIPEGWEVKNLKDMVELVKGNVTPSEIDPNTPYIGLEHINRKTIVLSDWANSDSANSDKTAFKKNDILFGKIRPYFHKVAVALFDGITSTDTIILRPKKNNFFGVSLETVFTDKFVEIATQSSTGSKMPRADWNVLQNYKVPVPADEELLELFQSVFDASLQKIESSVMESKRLIELRDWLLPMLMNGQVTINP